MGTITVENIVASASIAEHLDLQHIAETLKDSQYNPDEFQGLVLRYDEPRRIAALLFPDGKVVCTGAKQHQELETIFSKIQRQLTDAGIDNLALGEITVGSLAASTDLGQPADVAALSTKLSRENVEYNPSQLPALVFHLNETGTVVLLFNSGKMVCTGVKSVEEASQAFETLKDKVLSKEIA
jgi:transcription initiation factor TFIID TATA-box-binding protein